MRRRTLIFSVLLFFVTYSIVTGYDNTDAREAKREFELTYQATIQDIPSRANQIRVWIPLAHTVGYQKILERRIHGPSPYEIFQEAEHGNEILYFSLEPPLPSKMDVTVTYHAVVEGRTDPLEEPHFERKRYLQSTRKMVVDERIRALSKEVTEGKRLPLTQARALYEYVISHMRYDKTAPGWGKGDTLRACLIGKGNCTDFHSLFISLARAGEIPSRFKIGLPLPKTSEGEIPGYHCWAEFYLDGKGWVPIDASEAWKDPKKHDDYFGTHDENRLLISTGRDIQLVPKQEGDPINIFFYPYVELDGRVFSNVATAFHFKEVRQR